MLKYAKPTDGYIFERKKNVVVFATNGYIVKLENPE